ncbi:MAG: hypothetical protein LBR34_05980, partial [Prevotella sp.]|nr:hypothetical protein [Prevotella sp.]
MDLIRPQNKEVVYTFPFCFLLAEYVLGMYVYWMLPGEYNWIDEALALVLFAWTIMYAIRVKKEPFDKETLIFTCIALFYLLYSFLIRSNIPIAICSDFFVQVKPFIGYFMFIYIGFTLNDRQKEILKQLSLFLFFVTLALLIINLPTGLMRTLIHVFGHPTHYGTGLISIAFVYLFCSDLKNKKDVLIFVIILSFSLLSTRSKIYGFYAAAMFFTLVLRGNIVLKFSLRNILILAMLIPIVVYVAWTKINFYFVDFNDFDKETIARPMLYYTGWQLLFDYFPFGSGLASFGSFHSGVYYSPLYEEYGLDMVWGLEPESPDF